MAVPSTTFLDRLLATARHSPDAPALVHPFQGVWVQRRWRDVLAEVDRYAQALGRLGLRAGETVAFDGEITARLFLTAAAVQCSGGVIRPVATGASADDLGILLAATRPVAVVAQGREAVGKWSTATGTGRPLPVLFDHSTPNGRSPLPNVQTLERVRDDAGSAGWADDLPRERRLPKRIQPIWAEESTDWSAGLATLLESWVDGAPLALPELLVAAARDRAAAGAGHWIASAATLNRAARAIDERLPSSRRLTGRFVQRALSGGRSPLSQLIVRRLRRQLGLAGLDGIELHVDGVERLAAGTRQLFQSLGAPIDRADARPAVPAPTDLHATATA